MIARLRPLLTLAAAAAVLACLPAVAGAEPAVPSERTLYADGHQGRRMLDGIWHFRLDSADEGLDAGWQNDDSLESWEGVTVPHSWNSADLSNESQVGGVGWYRKDFLVPEASPTTTWKLRFESVNYRARVFLNGEEVGYNEFAYVPFEVPAEKLKPGEVNRLVVRVDSRRDAHDVPAARLQKSGAMGGGWWNDGGILREVYLRPVDRVDLENVLVRPTLRCRTCAAKVLVRARLENRSAEFQRVALQARIGSTPVQIKSLLLRPGRSAYTSGRVVIKRPRLWEPGSPVRYPVRVTASIAGTVVGAHRMHVGVRRIEVDDKGRMRINGRAVKLRGASMHEDRLNVGAALSRAQIDENFAGLRRLGATITRAHYPLHPRTMELADRAGMMVWEQIPFNRERFQVNDATQLRDDEAVRIDGVRLKGYLFMARAIRRDQNHPSVFAWSMGNELEARPGPEIRRYISESSRRIRKLDPTRLVALDITGYPHLPAFSLYKRKLDAIGVNSYFGWYAGVRGRVANRYGLPFYLHRLHRYYPKQALFMTEFGAEAGAEGPVDQKGTYAFQTDLLNFHLDRYDERPWINGAIVWNLRDFRVQPGWAGGNPTPDPPWNQKGLIDRWGGRKPAFDALARRFGRTRTLSPVPRVRR